VSTRKARFAVGERVTVRAAVVPGHVRTPGYIRGRSGIVERLCGDFANPEQLAYARAAEPRLLYRVRFMQRDVWPGDQGHREDTLDLEIFEHWLE